MSVRLGTRGLRMKIRVTDAGAPVDLSAATGLALLLTPPGNPTSAPFQVAPTLLTTGQDGWVTWTDTAGVATNAPGGWQAQLWWKDAAGTWPTDPFGYIVGPSLAPTIA